MNLTAQFHALQGRWDQAEEALAEFTRLMPREVSSPAEYLNHYYTGFHLLVFQGDLLGAARQVEEAHEDIGMLDPGRFPFHGLAMVGVLVFRLRRRGDPEAVRRAEELTAYLWANLNHDRGRISPMGHLGRRMLEGFLAEDPAEMVEHLRVTAETAERTGYRGLQLRSLMGAFHGALDLGDLNQARALLERYESFLGPGVAWNFSREGERMRQALREASPDPAQLPAGLTPREAEVLAEVAKGSSNRQVGQALFISAKTVSVHLSHILAKLGLTNRTEAAAAAHRLGLTTED
jgi:DNA-binding NarL/FixJ family response regulator